MNSERGAASDRLVYDRLLSLVTISGSEAPGGSFGARERRAHVRRFPAKHVWRESIGKVLVSELGRSAVESELSEVRLCVC